MRSIYKVIYIALIIVLGGCKATISVLVVDTLENGKYHVVGMGNDYMEVIKLPDGTSEGDIIKIKIKKDEN